MREYTTDELLELVRDAYVSGFEASSEGFNGELLKDGEVDEELVQKQFGKWVAERVGMDAEKYEEVWEENHA